MTAVTLFSCRPHTRVGGVSVGVQEQVFLVVECDVQMWCVVASKVVVSFRPVSASSLTHCCVYRSGLSIPWSAGGLIPPRG